MAEVYFDPDVGGDGSTVSDDANPDTGLRNHGWVSRFVPSLAQLVAVAQWVRARALEVMGAAAAAEDAAATAAAAALAAVGADATVGEHVQRLYAVASEAVVTRDAEGRLETITETLAEGGSRVTTITRSAGKITTVVTVAGGVTRTETLGRDGAGVMTSIAAGEV